MDLNCPNCGGGVPHNLKYAKLVVCPQCQTSLFLEDDAVRNAGERSAIADDPSIFTIGLPFDYRGVAYVPHGRFRFDYGQGYWDEWWVGADTGEALWVSVDEGDIVMQKPMELKSAPPYERLSLGQTLKVGSDQLKVTEKNWSRCLGYEGELPEVIAVGEEHGYVHLSGPNGLLLTVEYYSDKTQIFRGHWIDPFEVKTL
ncbi:MAG: DUF4178 domain-containing protein [Gammaproteobacteria bacterium]|nr:DUF4178 domain-containing protein [Gammaproteobacteria bacterium]